MTKESIEKSQKTRQENEKKIMEICGYEIWRDPLNYTTVKDGKNNYFSTFQNALIDIRKEMVRKDLAGAKTLEIAINRIEEVDSRFIKALLTCLDKLGRE